MQNVFTANFRMLMSVGAWTQMEAAKQLGISQSLVSRYIHGVTRPPRKSVEAIAYRLGVPAESLLTKSLTLPEMRRLLQKNSPGAPRAKRSLSPNAQPHGPWMRSLKRRWQRRPQERDSLSTALRLLFPEDYESVMKWLGKK
jgi:transcriptional regulator with XRE-family HTH domain